MEAGAVAATLDSLKGLGNLATSLTKFATIPFLGLLLYLHADLRGEIRSLRGDLGNLAETVADLRVAVATIEAKDPLRSELAKRFAASGEGASYGDPVSAAGVLLALAPPEIEAMLGRRDSDAQPGVSALDRDALTELADELWEDRANILAQAAPIP